MKFISLTVFQDADFVQATPVIGQDGPVTSVRLLQHHWPVRDTEQVKYQHLKQRLSINYFSKEGLPGTKLCEEISASSNQKLEYRKG